MSERWKYQIKIGLFWSVFMTVFNMIFEIREHPIREQISNPNFYYRAFSEIIVGIFIIGYLFLKSKKNIRNS